MKRSKLYYLTHPSVTLPALWAKISDRYAIEQQWKNVMGYPLNLDNPQTFNEKLQWLKLYDHNPLYTTLVDKYKVKKWVADKIGEQYIIPTLAVYKSVKDIVHDEVIIGVMLRLGLPRDGVEHRMLVAQMSLTDTVVQRPQMLKRAAVGTLRVCGEGTRRKRRDQQQHSENMMVFLHKLFIWGAKV